MTYRLLLLQLLLLTVHVSMSGQSRYALEKCSFSSPLYDDFCPSLWGDTLLFCSNREGRTFISYHDERNKGLFSIFTVNLEEEGAGNIPKLLSKSLFTSFNDGPAAFRPDGQGIVFSRNIQVSSRSRSIKDASNSLGLFFAEEIDGSWSLVDEFPHNNADFSITTPCYSPDGRYLYFGSDMPGGFGGADLYRSEWKDGEWDVPVNLGRDINTSGNEVYPFVAGNGDLFFASDGHGSLGGKDLYLTRFDGEHWLIPLHLKPPLNSEDDDFGLVTNADFSEGYLSSRREGRDDIFKFYTLIPELFDCDTMLKNNYCYEFWDEEFPGVDSMPVIYEWTFSDGTILPGLQVTHCFPGPGSHWARLDIIDNRTEESFFTQSTLEFELTAHEQAYITGRDAGLRDRSFSFSGVHSNQPGFVTDQYIWDFGDGGFAQGSEVEHVFDETGTYVVKLGLKGRTEGAIESQIRCVQTPVKVVADYQALAMYMAGDGLHTGAGDSLYTGTGDEVEQKLDHKQSNQGEMDRGRMAAQVKIYMLAQSLVEETEAGDLSFIRDACIVFENEKISPDSYPVLDRVAAIMELYPDLVLQIAGHANTGETAEDNLELSGNWSQELLKYLISKGIENERLEGRGYGEARPIASNSTREGRKMNCRLEFIFISQSEFQDQDIPGE